jgi:transposase
LSTNGNLKYNIVEGKVDSDKVIEVFNCFAENITKQTVVILDNASIHTSKKFKANIPKWLEMGLTIIYLPPYSPELNLIEILWKFIKYYWIEFSAFISYDNMKNYVEKILKNYGTQYLINFGKPLKRLAYIKNFEMTIDD